MIFIIKIFLLSLLLYSCSTTNDYREVFFNFIDIEIRSDLLEIPNDAKTYNKSNPSLNVRFRNNVNTKFKLQKKIGQKKYWISKHDEVLITSQGRIVKSIGFDNNFEYINYHSLENIALKVIKNNKNTKNYISYTKFSNPVTGFLTTKSSYQISKKLKHHKYKIIEESVEIKKIRFKAINYYWVDSNFNIFYSIQTPIPGFTINISGT